MKNGEPQNIAEPLEIEPDISSDPSVENTVDQEVQIDESNLTDPYLTLDSTLNPGLNSSVEARLFSGELIADPSMQKAQDGKQATTPLSPHPMQNLEDTPDFQQLGSTELPSQSTENDQGLIAQPEQSHDPLNKTDSLVLTAQTTLQKSGLDIPSNFTLQSAIETGIPSVSMAPNDSAQIASPLETMTVDATTSTTNPMPKDVMQPVASQNQLSFSSEVAKNASNVDLAATKQSPTQVETAGTPSPALATPTSLTEADVIPPHIDTEIIAKPVKAGPEQTNTLAGPLQEITDIDFPNISRNGDTLQSPGAQSTQDITSNSFMGPAQPTSDVTSSSFIAPVPSQPSTDTRGIKTSAVMSKGDTSSPVATTVGDGTQLTDLNAQEFTGDIDANLDVLDGMTDDFLPLSRGNDFNNLPQMLTEASVRASSTHYSTENPRLVGQQLAEAVVSHDGDQVEVALNPAELGKVNMRLTTTDVGVMIVIQAERPETEDLMRRHIDELMKEFKEMGFTDIGFEFSSGGDTSQSHETGHGPDGSVDTGDDDDFERMPEELLAQLNIATDGLDIRI